MPGSKRHRRAIGYARVSSQDQALGTSLRDQQEAIKAYAKASGVSLAHVYVEAESAIQEKIERREQMRALLVDVRAGDLVLCSKLDRWSRDPEFTYRSVREILAKGAHFFAIDDRVDPSTPEGDTALGFRILFAREEHKRIRERTIGTRNLLRARGYYVEGRPPFGYRRRAPAGTRSVEKNILIIEPREAELVRRMYRLCVAGKSLTQICAALELDKKRVWGSLHSRHYLGEIRTDAGWIKGLHPAIIEPALWASANDLLSKRRHGGPRARSAPARTDTWILRDVARCGRCGGRMSSAYGNDNAVDHYYRCWHHCLSKGNHATNGSFVRVDRIEAEFAPLMVQHLAELREEITSGGEEEIATPVDYDGRRAKLQKKRARYIEAHSDDLMTRDELRAALEKLDGALLRLGVEESKQAKPMTPALRRELLRELSQIEKAWRGAARRIQRELVNLTVERADMANGYPLRVTWKTKEALFAVGSQ